ncbi:MAG: EamA family transporter, partial [Candidatus Levyibacteriota bacterium]
SLPTKIAAGIVNVLSIYLLTLALKVGPISIVSAIYQGMMVFGVLAGIFILGEKEDIKKKLIGTAIAMAGVILLSI